MAATYEHFDILMYAYENGLPGDMIQHIVLLKVAI